MSAVASKRLVARVAAWPQPPSTAQHLVVREDELLREVPERKPPALKLAPLGLAGAEADDIDALQALVSNVRHVVLRRRFRRASSQEPVRCFAIRARSAGSDAHQVGTVAAREERPAELRQRDLRLPRGAVLDDRYNRSHAHLILEAREDRRVGVDEINLLVLDCGFEQGLRKRCPKYQRLPSQDGSERAHRLLGSNSGEPHQLCTSL